MDDPAAQQKMMAEKMAAAASKVKIAQPPVQEKKENQSPNDAAAKESSCNKCGKAAKNICSRCRTVHYCSVTCQKSDWSTHKLNCKKAEAVVK